uniref:Uncharacterized protein n=1 Tax=Lepeophtheirus salmonis TaxID=72036 RepID=A0A0K2VC57_LEPSM
MAWCCLIEYNTLSIDQFSRLLVYHLLQFGQLLTIKVRIECFTRWEQLLVDYFFTILPKAEQSLLRR